MSQSLSDLDLSQLDQGTREVIAKALINYRTRQAKRDLWQPLPHQVVPARDGTWNVFLILGGRGCGKTRAGAEYVLKHLRELGPKARVGVGAPTLRDARRVCALGHSGVITIGGTGQGGEFTYWNQTDLIARHVNGGVVEFIGSETPARWNGPQWTLLWTDELALWQEESWEQARFGVRLPPDPHIIVTTTPKNRLFVRNLSTHEKCYVRRARTIDNAQHLAQAAIDDLYETYGGTRLGRQELEGEFIEDADGALWKRAWIDQHRVRYMPPSFKKIVVSVDPAPSAKTSSDFTGICVAALADNRHYYVLHTAKLKVSPSEWAQQAIALYEQYQANEIVAEVNQGYDMVLTTFRSVMPDGEVAPPIRAIHAHRGKVIRAEPVAALYEQGRVHHVGFHADLEDEMCLFPVEAPNDDMVDATAQAITALGGGKRQFRTY